MKTTASVWIFAFVVGFYRTFVLQSLWNWFAAGALGMPSVSYLQMYGLNLIVQLLLERSSFEERVRWDQLGIMCLATVPPEMKAQVNAELTEKRDNIWTEARTEVIASFVGNTATLAIGWFVHALAG